MTGTVRPRGLSRTPLAIDDDVDVLIVGAGPAGLFAALGITATSGASVLVIDAGEDIDSRLELAGGTDRARGAALVQGVGGAGLFSDGKLCLSLRVGGDLPAVLSRHDRQCLLEVVAAALGVPDRVEEPELQITPASNGRLEFTAYHVLHIGTDHCADRIAEVRGTVIRAGAQLRARCELTGLVRMSDTGMFVAHVRQDGTDRAIRATKVVLAMGKVGSEREATICRQLGASVASQPMYVGLRLDTDAQRTRRLFERTEDPKFKLHFADGTKVKTHCAAEGGAVLPLYYDGLPLAGGHALRGRGSGRTSFGVLWDGVRDVPDARADARAMMVRASDAAGGRLLAQRLVDYVAGRPSTAEDVIQARPSTDAWMPGDVRLALPASYFPRFDAFLSAIAGHAPDLIHPTTVLFAPAIEWWMSKVETNASLQTHVPGLYVAGDGAGWSQGIVHAAATGLLVAEGISGVSLDVRSSFVTDARVV